MSKTDGASEEDMASIIGNFVSELEEIRKTLGKVKGEIWAASVYNSWSHSNSMSLLLNVVDKMLGDHSVKAENLQLAEVLSGRVTKNMADQVRLTLTTIYPKNPGESEADYNARMLPRSQEFIKDIDTLHNKQKEYEGIYSV